MSTMISQERLQRFLQATPEQQAMVDRILAGRPDTKLALAPTPAPPPMLDELLTKKEVAARLKVTTRTVENWMRKGIIPFIKVKKVTLFCWDDVMKHLKANHQVCRRTARV